MILAGIQTKYLGPTNTNGARIKAQRTDHKTGDKTVTVAYDHSLSYDDRHVEAAKKLAEHYEWTGQYVACATNNGHVFTRTNGTIDSFDTAMVVE